MDKEFDDTLKEIVGEEKYEKISAELKALKRNPKKVIVKKHRRREHQEPGEMKHPNQNPSRRHEGHDFKEYKHPHYREPRGFKKPHKMQKTKLFTNKDEMVSFVNLKGEEGHQIDIFKIEESLYKVVIIERRH